MVVLPAASRPTWGSAAQSGRVLGQAGPNAGAANQAASSSSQRPALRRPAPTRTIRMRISFFPKRRVSAFDTMRPIFAEAGGCVPVRLLQQGGEGAATRGVCVCCACGGRAGGGATGAGLACVGHGGGGVSTCEAAGVSQRWRLGKGPTTTCAVCAGERAAGVQVRGASLQGLQQNRRKAPCGLGCTAMQSWPGVPHRRGGV